VTIATLGERASLRKGAQYSGALHRVNTGVKGLPFAHHLTTQELRKISAIPR
jgi:hypothetical protein